MGKNKRVTIYDVAREVGLSVSTVSRVLNDSTLISDEKTELIRRTADRMGYVKRTIRRHSSRTILNIKLFLPLHKESALHFFYNPQELIDQIKQGFGETRVNIIAIAESERTVSFDNKRLGQIDGCIFAFDRPEPELRRILIQRRIPFVLLNRRDDTDNYICSDNPGGMAFLVDQLVHAANRKGIELKSVYLGYDPVKEISEQRADGYCMGCERNGVPFSPEDVKHLHSLADINDELFAELKERGVNAVTTFNDVLAVYFYQAALHRGIRIPQDMMLVGFDNSPVSDLLDRRIDTIDLGTSSLGFEAGQWLREVVIERQPARIQEMVFGDYIPGQTIELPSGIAAQG